ncbi:hypothetical protein QRD89_14445 [Halobacillus sp. ACCC02827]|uniref:hypothetical protein n=1 Tax=Bacillaceae TaxID=186817 RepID=UPI0002ED02AC|nr:MULTISPECIES: hypothetical protein [Bacillaceae]QHT47669.1 hypothetical protein M662_14650 [Bacillus sp. SB49]WJE14908.1 hypothetical protein QRD89_14445 [Halobacillus sp. ACCC02827]
MMCNECRDVKERLKRQEDTIAQLVTIIAATNRRVSDMDQFLHEPLKEEVTPSPI